MIFVVTLSKHRNFGNLLVPYFAEQTPGEPYLRLLRRVRQHDLTENPSQFTAEETKIVKHTERYSDEKLIKRFSPGKPSSEFLLLIRKDDMRQKVISYIESVLTELLDILKTSTLPIYQRRDKYDNLYKEDLITLCYEDTGTVFNFHRLEDETRYFLTLRNGEEHFSLLKKNVEILVNEPCRIYYQNRIYFFDQISASKLLPFREKEFISIPKKMEDKYYETFILNAIKCQEVRSSGFEIRKINPVKGVILSLELDLNEMPVFILYFTYNGLKLHLKEGEHRAVVLKKSDNQYIFEVFSRDLDWENDKLSLLRELELTGSPEGLKLDISPSILHNEALYQTIGWLSIHSDVLRKSGFILSQSQLLNPYFLGNHDLKIVVQDKIDWFDLEMTLQIGEWNIPFIRFKRLIYNKIREYKLPDGEIFILPETWFAQFGEIFSFAKTEANRLILKPFHFMLLDGNISSAQPDLQENIRSLSNKKIENREIPKNLNAQLRNYQHDGYNWLYHLWENRMNGCLADDMGLGKTLQTLVILMKLKRKKEIGYLPRIDSRGQLSLFADNNPVAEEHQPASLIVLPVSLIHNWENEIAKFAPSLKVYSYSGIKRREKIDISTAIHLCDIILTTYGTVRNDVEELTKHTFFYLILDESQNIKNSESKSYHALASLHSSHRLSLTGTPIENSLSDLWSQMNFLNPGQLGSFKFFRENYMLPIERDQDPDAASRLQRLIEPFILRRTKEQVAADLPPVMEELLTIAMTAGQSELYESEKSSVRNWLLQNMDDREPRNTTFIVLQALTRLRQIAIHPRLVDPGSDLESGKFNEILAMLEVLVAENHKILVFSSFVKHINLLDAACKQNNWGFCRLTGQTTDRKSVIEEFQFDSRKNIFLISLKAGGVGLNLTAADYIFIVDPWWNPAAEMQAVSRAHRIGQDKKVFVYRFISEKSIEEKIQVLQEKKAALANQFINRNDPFAIFGKDELIQLFE
ncbi:MAG TPA: DEAD/DEAH box helicase [Prolixibacteraceae bacterium]